MLASNVINELYNKLYEEYENPYQGDDKYKFIKQTFDIILYMPIPSDDVGVMLIKN